jgi:membrane protease YdiL (CAAX protease family)
LNDPEAPSRGLLLFRAVVGIVAFGLLGYSFTTVLGLLVFGAAQAVGGAFDTWANNPASGQIVLVGLASVIGFWAANVVVGRVAFRLTAADLRWRRTGPAGRGFLVAFGSGLALAGLILVLGAAVGGARWGPDQGDAAQYARQIGVVLLILAPSALAEEIVFRGMPMILFERAAGRGVAIGIMALLFALAHSQNTGITTLGIGNICVAGLLLGTAFYAPGGIWTAAGFHLGWNWAIAALDAPVSGIDLKIPFINYDPGGPVWLTGGKFGPEGGVLATLVLGTATIVATRLVLHKRRIED